MCGNERTPQDKICSYEYTVKRGDSFYLIAHRLGVPLRDLLEANSDINPARLMVGDVLCIPMEEDDAVQEPAREPEAAEPTPAPTPTPTPTPEIQIETPVPEVEAEPEPVPQAEAQAEDQPADLLDHPATGGETQQSTPQVQVEVAPSSDSASQVEIELNQTTDAAPSASGSACPDCPSGECYTVAAGETVTDIQKAADLSLLTLQSANPNADLDALQGGQRLCVPSANLPCNTYTIYTMGPDETLESVALAMDVSVGALLRANPCLAPSGFVSGAAICVPMGVLS